MATTVNGVEKPAPAHHQSRGWLAAAAVAIAALIGGGIAAGLVFAGGPSQVSPAYRSAQLASVHAACQRWLDASPAEPGTNRWCTGMAGWMSQAIEERALGPQMMWGTPTSFQSGCERWWKATPPSHAVNATGWCQAMVAWMKANVETWSGRRSWGGWMSHGPMTGGFGP